MEKEFSEYIMELQHGSEVTSWAEDRAIYDKLIRHAGLILAQISLGVSKNEILKLVNEHERLWGHLWIKDPVYKKALNIFQSFKYNNL